MCYYKFPYLLIVNTTRNGIDVQVELEGVGENFQDHTAISVSVLISSSTNTYMILLDCLEIETRLPFK